ncbi:cell division protein FtsX [Aquirufa regiilacus]|uniref:Cell division protein FtsX n=1 Tax=Aquirufa regiilacus TaxID=3024868 RepID=A0ABU3TQP1_9BACT|nr:MULTISPECIES: permease-like cell division protein FtsX [unclassified Aquirufa]MDT8886851.1 permease-like cell division protein FtsX [Aquirufa sp. LEPPI-3A]MDU0808184.1 permease-like cell division protein FtsX [Aquirufa sp. LEOWEIH-7C]
MRYSKGRAQATNQIIVISIACLSVVVSLLFQMLSGAYTWGESIQAQMKVYVYLDDSLQTNQIDSTVLVLKNRKEFIASSAQLVDKQSIAKDFLNTTHENFDELLGDVNPFKNLLILQTKPEFRNKASFEKIATSLRSSPGIYEVTYPENYLELIIPKIKVISSAALIFVLLIALIVYFQISNYTKLHIHANRTMIKSMQLLGSTNGFIKKPYLLKSVILGLFGSLLGYLITNVFYFYINNQIPELTSYIFNVTNQLIILVGTMTIAILFSLVSTLLTLNKYLKLSASNLY